MGLMSITDLPFLLVESREHPTHVGLLLVLRKPDGAGPDYVGGLYRAALTYDKIDPLFAKHPKQPVDLAGRIMWEENVEVDLDYHVRMSALPHPGTQRQLVDLVSRMHGTLLDRHRPLWECHFVDGLENARFAIYFKIHHALVDGVGGVQIGRRAFSERPDVQTAPPWAAVDSSFRQRVGGARGRMRTLAAVARAGADVARTFARAALDMARPGGPVAPFTAPRTILNQPITGARRFAGRTFAIARLKAVAHAHGASLNDVVLALSAGGLRTYLAERDALPERPLVAAVPVSIRKTDDGRGGNSISAMLCDLATQHADPVERLRAITASTRAAKDSLAGAGTAGSVALAAAVLGVPALLGAVPGAGALIPPAYSLIISNVPGPKQIQYWNGAEVESWFPVSVPFEGQALNITVVSYATDISFGLIGCRTRMPGLERLLDGIEAGLLELETRM